MPVVFFTLLIVVFAEGKSWKKTILWGILIAWIVGVAYLMFLYRLPGGQGIVTFDFFHMFRAARDYDGSIETNQALRQILFNILLFVPLGAVLFSMIGKVWFAALIGIGVSILTEGLQYMTDLGWADVDDVISNTLGLVLGVYLYRAGRHVRGSTE